MCVLNTGKIYLFAFLCIFISVFFGSCDAIDTILPSAGSYKISIEINDILLDDCSFITSNDNIRPVFEDPVSKDQDVTGLIIFIKNTSGEINGSRVTYSIFDEEPPRRSSDQTDDNFIIHIDNFDDVLPLFSLPDNLAIGSYTIVSQVMNGRGVLQKTEKLFYYLGKNDFSFKGISVYLPGIAENLQFIQKGTVVMLEADLEFSGDLNPYVVWYEGRKKISEGSFSDGAGQLFWKTPDQSGFYSIRAEIFPVRILDRLAGFREDISLLVSSKTVDIHMVSWNIPQLISWYTFEGNMDNSKIPAAAGQLVLNPGNSVKWMGANGTYGIATGYNNTVSLPKNAIPDSEIKTWQTIFRFMHVNDGGIFTIVFDSLKHVYMHLFMEDRNLVLTLTSPPMTVSQIYTLPEAEEDSPKPFFRTAGINFSVMPGLLSAQINFMDGFIGSDPLMIPISVEAEIEEEFQIILGALEENNMFSNIQTGSISALTALWDEFALYYMPPMDIIFEDAKSRVAEEEQAAADAH
ncbi:MAG: hypothetical protein FWC06_05690 [Treponema sp.]|nr:hypothetical protein [Treponema sp.]